MTEFKEEIKDKRVSLAMSQTDYYRLELEAGKRHISMSELIRKLINHLYTQNHENKLQIR